MSTSNEIPMYLVSDELTPAQQEQAFVILRNTTKNTRLDRFLHAVRKVGTPIQPCVDVETVAWMTKASKHTPTVCRDVTVNVPYDRCNYDDLVFRTDMEAQVARVKAESRLDAKAITHRIIRDVSELSDRTSPKCEPDLLLVKVDELEGIICTAINERAAK